VGPESLESEFATSVLGASPWYYCDLILQEALTHEESRRRQAILSGIQTYVRVLCAQKRIGIDVLADVMWLPPEALTRWIADSAAPLSGQALLLALVYLDVPLTDIAEIVHATSNHEALGRRLAEERSAYAVEAPQDEHPTRTASRNVPALESISRRLAVMLRNGQDLPPVLKHELTRIIDDLDHYHTRMSVGLESFMASL
jgi:hypothetical protein